MSNEELRQKAEVLYKKARAYDLFRETCEELLAEKGNLTVTLKEIILVFKVGGELWHFTQ